MFRWIVGLLVFLAVGGGVTYYSLRDDPLRAELDRRWPPVSAEQQRQAAIGTALSALKGLAAPNVAAGADIVTIQRIAFDEVRSKGVTKLALATDRQLLRLTADFDLTLTPEDLPNDADKRSLVAALAPRVVGEVELFLTAATFVSDAPQRALLVKLLPAVSRVRIDKLTVKGSYDVTAAAEAIAFLLNRYADNLSGALSASPVMNVTLPATLQDGFDPSGPIKVDLKEAPGLKLSLASRPVRSPFRLGASAWLIDAGEVIAIAGLTPLDKPLAQTDPDKGSFDDMRAAFKKSLQDGLGIVALPAGVWAALGKALVAQGLDSAFAQAQPCLDGFGPIPTETFSAKIPTPDGSDIDCTPTRDCTPNRACNFTMSHDDRDCTPTRDCTFARSHDDRSCGDICILPRPWGGCAQSIHDLVCEAAKATQNQVYEADYAGKKLDCERLKTTEKAQCEGEKDAQNKIYAADFAAKKLDCERLKSQEKLQCETEKTGQKVACEAEKGVIVGLHRTGNFGNVTGSVAGMGSLKMCFQDVHFGASLDKLALTIAASGSATLDTHFRFVPLDVAGHVLCPFEWTADKNITTSVPPQSIGANVSLARQTDLGILTYQGALDGLRIKLHFQPSPLALVLQNVNFYLACPPAAGLINGLTLGLGPFLPEFLKDYTYKVKPVTFSFTPSLPAQSILGQSIKPKLSETPLALVVSGTP